LLRASTRAGTLSGVNVIDLRSDTVTRPTAEMRRAIAEAEVGDDVYGEDPSVLRLQQIAADVVGMEAALFVPSGTMANQIAIGLHTQPGDVVLAGRNSHILLFEGGGAAALSGVQIQTLGTDGLFDEDDVLAAAAVDDIHCPPTTLLSLENTHNAGGGRVWPLDRLTRVADAARARKMAVHLDGARLFNAVIASGVRAAELAKPVDTLSFCLSKGLGAPVGSLICGSASDIARADRARKRLGGGMRQAGFLAAAGIYALEHHIDRLAHDHDNAKRLAKGLEDLGLAVERAPETNIVMFQTPGAPALVDSLRARGVLVSSMGPNRIRAVTHLDVETRAIDEALRLVAAALRA
jgi:threonine aldolase